MIFHFRQLGKLFFLIFLVTISSKTHAQHLFNGDIEILDQNGWPVNWRGVGRTQWLSIDSSISFNGKYCLKITDPAQSNGDNAGYRTAMCGAIPDSLYTVSCKIRTLSSSATLYIEFFDKSGNRIFHDLKDQSSQAQWSTMSISAKAPVNADSVGLLFYSKSFNTGTIYGDAFQIIGPKPVREESTSAVYCEDEKVTFFGTPIDSSGLYSIDIDSGCFLRRVNRLITLQPSYSLSLADITVCENEFLMINDDTIFKPGVYRDSLQTQYGCDSIVQYRIIHKTADTTVLSDLNTCEGTEVKFFNLLVDTSGRYEMRLKGSNFCDSLIVQNISIHPSYSETLPPLTICPGDVINVFGNSVSKAGIYTRTYQTSKGCDSTLTRLVNVHPVNENVIAIGPSAYAMEDSALSYLWINCDLGTVINEETKRQFTAKRSGYYAVKVTSKAGCDFTSPCVFLEVKDDTCLVTLYDTIIHQLYDTNKIQVYDTTELTIEVYDTIYSYLSVADTLRINLNNVQGCGNIDVKLYPNPARNFVYLEVSDFDCLVMSKFNLYNSIGQILWTNQLVEDRVIKIPVHTLAAGVYHVDCLDSLGNRMFVKKLVLYR